MRPSRTGRSVDFITARPIAHRGLHAPDKGVIENTRSAFAAAIDKGYAIECDLQITRDGEAVVFHDEWLDRLTDAKGRLKDLTASEIKAVAIRKSSDRVQTLAEMLEQVDGRVPLVIELKSHWDGDTRLAERAIAVLKDYKGPYCIMSFDPDVIDTVRKLSPGTIRGIVGDRAFGPFYDMLPLRKRQELRTFGFLDRTDPDFVSFYLDDLPHAPVSAFRAAGRPVISWTIRSPEQAREAMRYTDQITFERFDA